MTLLTVWNDTEPETPVLRTQDPAAIRFFHDEDGWVGTFTGSDISTRFPDFDTLTAGRAAAAIA